MRAVFNNVSGTHLKARFIRSSFWAFSSHFFLQFIRLGTNLILTRLLFPEAFGLMSLISVILIGLAMFSDVGISPSIQQSARGDERDFLNTAWTIQVIRGIGLWVFACLIAYPVGLFYDEAILTQLLPVAALILIIDGFIPTRTHTANRHLRIGKLTTLEVIASFLGSALLIILTYFWPSVWALAIGGTFSSLIKLCLVHFSLEGEKNYFRWDKTAVEELIHFGKWVFLSTIFGFIASQGDRALLGKYLSLEQLGIFSIGYFFATALQTLGNVTAHKVLIPLYREKPPAVSRKNFKDLQKMRFIFTGVLFFPAVFLIWAGPEIIRILYDQRYYASGGIIVLLSFTGLIQIIGNTYSHIALATGDSRSFFYFSGFRALVQFLFFWLGLSLFGLVGAIVCQGVAYILVYFMLSWLARKHQAWDPVHDLTYFFMGAVFGGALVYFNKDAIAVLNTF